VRGRRPAGARIPEVTTVLCLFRGPLLAGHL
jgi:hypothetical protein